MVIERRSQGGATGAGPAIVYQRGLEYLQTLQGLALDPAMVDVLHNLRDRTAICTWIGLYHGPLNVQLQTYLQACQECFHLQSRPPVQIFAVPLASAFGLDGVCNSAMHPTTILVDLGRVLPQDWLRLVTHEYAHAQVGAPGHHAAFVAVLSHLCLGLGLEAPPPTATDWPHWPRCQPTLDPLAFWRGAAGAPPLSP